MNARVYVVFAVAVAACARVNVESKKRADYDKKLERTLVAFTAFDKFSKEYRQLLHDRAIAEFGKRGVTIQFAATVSDSLGLDDEPSLDKQAKEVNASSVLIVRPVGGTVDSVGQIVNANLDAQLYDVPTRKRVWRANIQYAAGGSLTPDSSRVEKLLNGITSALTADGLLSPLESPGATQPALAAPSTPAPDSSPAAGASTAGIVGDRAEGATDSFPRVMIGREIAAHFERHRKIEATLGRQRFTLVLGPENRVERDCPGCRITHDDGEMNVDVQRALVCFHWNHTYFPDSGCYQVVQTAADRFTMRGINQERSMQYSASP